MLAEAFAENMPNYEKMAPVTKTLTGAEIDRHAMRTTASLTSQDKLSTMEDLKEDDLLFAPPVLYGFSLADKQWRKSFIFTPSVCLTRPAVEFAVDFIESFDWNKEAYENLVIPPEQKSVLTTLVEAHSSGPASQIDDFVKGKGMGLVINLYGNPGTGDLALDKLSSISAN